MKWEYGMQMLEQGDIQSAKEWSDDKEMALSIMDQHFDYRWQFDNGKIKFIDALYDSSMNDETVEQRKKNGTAVMVFDNFEDVFRWILKESKGRTWYGKAIENRLQKGVWDEDNE